MSPEATIDTETTDDAGAIDIDPSALSVIDKISLLAPHTLEFAKFVWQVTREDTDRGARLRHVLTEVGSREAARGIIVGGAYAAARLLTGPGVALAASAALLALTIAADKSGIKSGDRQDA